MLFLVPGERVVHVAATLDPEFITIYLDSQPVKRCSGKHRQSERSAQSAQLVVGDLPRNWSEQSQAVQPASTLHQVHPTQRPISTLHHMLVIHYAPYAV